MRISDWSSDVCSSDPPGYDQTKSTVVDGMKITSVSFLDLPGVSGDVTVTLTGAGAVSVGTLIIGRIAAMGLTEDTPSVGITDFSRKETDEFGLTVPVERAWAKRMTVRRSEEHTSELQSLMRLSY